MARNSNPRPLSAAFAPRPKSMLYSMLPSIVQSRLPRLPSLRRSVSMYGPTTRRKDPQSVPGSGTRTPVADFANAMVLSDVRTEEELYFADGMSSDEDLTQRQTIEALDGKGRQVVLDEEKSGISWKFANQGLNLLSLAVSESSTISQNPRFGNATFARQLYLHAMTYLLKALPSNLTTEEQLSLRSALPDGAVEPLHLRIDPAYSSNPASVQPSLLHRTLASTIVQLFILFQYILPYVKYLLSAAYQYEREHKISEKVLAQSIETVDQVGKRGLSASEAIFAMGDGKMGQFVVGAANWFVVGVTGGIHDGLSEGMNLLSGRRPGSSSGIKF